MKRILITAIILLAWTSAWAGSTTVVVGQGAAPAASCGETAWAAQETHNVTYAGDFDQGIASSGVTICRIDVWCGESGGYTANFTCGVFSAANGTGTQYGATQNWQEAPLTAAHWHTIEFSTNQPAPPGDFHVYVTQDGDGYWGYDSGGGYDSTDYYLTSNGTAFTSWDMTFRIFVME